MPHVPPEVFCHVIFQLDLAAMPYSELALVWSSLRLVSTLFRTEVEAAFEREVLPGMTVTFSPLSKPELELKHYAVREFGANFPDLPAAPESRAAPAQGAIFTFDKAHESTAVFHHRWLAKDLRGRMIKHPQSFYRKFYRQLNGGFSEDDNHEKAHHYVVQINGAHNDLAIPDMYIDEHDQTLYLDWKPVFCRLFAEETLAIEFAKEPAEATKGLLQEERRYHCHNSNGGDFRSILRSTRYKHWYNRCCDYIPYGVPEQEWLDREKLEQRMIETGLQKYHANFDHMVHTSKELRRIALHIKANQKLHEDAAKEVKSDGGATAALAYEEPRFVGYAETVSLGALARAFNRLEQ